MDAPGYKNIVIIRLSSLGDIVHAVPAFNLLRKQYPRAKISWFAEPAGAKLLKNVSGIDEIIVLNLKVKGFSNKIKEIMRIRSLYRKQFDLIIDFQGLLKSAVLARMLKGYAIGFGKKNLKEPQARYFYKHRVDPFDENNHVIFKNIHLIKGLVNPSNPLVVQYPLKHIPISQKLGDFLSGNSLERGQYIIFNIGGGWESKLLDIRQSIEIINRIKNRYGYPLVILWGNERERHAASEISRQTQTLMSDFFDFSELILFIQYSRLIVSADTLALHVADMVKTPSVGFFGPTSPWRNGSLLKESDAVYEKLACSFCYKKKCGKIDCIKRISIDKIIEAVEKVYEKRC
ncbi:MAG: glycosyltransferase family 9 protein [Candidatus Aminicenantes bacterium]|nr:MAG: glycosyltransferase family 9 protein [Candidatus Aminicenantes bacterium]